MRKQTLDFVRCRLTKRLPAPTDEQLTICLHLYAKLSWCIGQQHGNLLFDTLSPVFEAQFS